MFCTVVPHRQAWGYGSPLALGRRLRNGQARRSLHIRPDAFVGGGKPRQRENILHVAWARDRDDMLGGDAGGLAAEHQRAVAECDRLGYVMGDEDDGLAAQLPE